MTTPDPGSFRDPTSQVLLEGDRVLRALRGDGREGWEAFSGTGLLDRFVAGNRLVGTREVELSSSLRSDGWELLLEHDRVPFVSYPYEWTFSMLRDAAILQLDLLHDALEDDLTLVDATPYNIQWRGSAPLFIDVGSFRALSPGEPWLGYRQFCRLFLFPLMLTAYKGVAFQPWLRGSLEGISASDVHRLFSARQSLRRGVLTHVALQARAERRLQQTTVGIREEVGRAGFRKEMIQANVRSLRKLVRRLRWKTKPTRWSSYSTEHAHVRADRPAKTALVQGVLGRRRWGLVWDLGANDGHFARIAAAQSDAVIAIDADPETVEQLYLALAAEHSRIITPLLVDLADPSPSLGWGGAERRSLLERHSPEVVLCLALLHHLVIGRNVPMAAVVDWLASLSAEVVIEFADLDDPLVRRLTANKSAAEVHRDYDLATLRRLLAERFTVLREEALPSGHRTLLHVGPRT